MTRYPVPEYIKTPREDDPVHARLGAMIASFVAKTIARKHLRNDRDGEEILDITDVDELLLGDFTQKR